MKYRLLILPALAASLLLAQSRPSDSGSQPASREYTPDEANRLIKQYNEDLTDIDVVVTPEMEAKAIEACQVFNWAVAHQDSLDKNAAGGLNRMGIRAGFAAGYPSVMLAGAKMRWQLPSDNKKDYTAFALSWAGIFAGDAEAAKTGLTYLSKPPADKQYHEWAKQMLLIAADCGKPIDVNFAAADGTKIALSRYRGRSAVMFFWAVWCKPCYDCIQPLKDFVAQRKNDSNFVMMGFSQDDSVETALAGARDLGMKWPQALDQKIREKFLEAPTLPHIVVLSPKGTVLWQGHPGAKTTLAMTTDFARRQSARMANLPAGIATSMAAASQPATAVAVKPPPTSAPASRPVNPDDAHAAETNLRIANMYFQTGQREKGKAMLMEIVQKHPGTPAAQEAAKALLQLK